MLYLQYIFMYYDIFISLSFLVKEANTLTFYPNHYKQQKEFKAI